MEEKSCFSRSVRHVLELNIKVKEFALGLRKSIFFKNVFIVMSGTAGAQAVAFLMSPIISRLYAPPDFGILGSFNSILMVISAGVTLNYSQAIMLPHKKEDAINLLVLSCTSALVISTLCLAISCLRSEFFQGLLNFPNAWFLLILILAILISGLNKSLQSWSVRVKAFKYTSASQVVRSISSSGAQVGLGYMQYGAKGLVSATILGNTLAGLSLLRVVMPDLIALRHFIHWKSIKHVAKEYKDFPFYSAPREVLNALSRGLPVLLLNYYYGISVAGAYAFCIRIMSMPMSFVLQSLRQVLFQRASESYNQGGNLMALYLKTTGGLILLASIPSLVLFIWAPQLFSWVFGSQWFTAGEYARWLILWLAVMFCNLPSTLFAQIIRIQREAFLFDVVVLIARAGILIIGGMYLSALRTVLLFSVLGSALNLGWIIFVGRALKRRSSLITSDI